MFLVIAWPPGIQRTSYFIDYLHGSLDLKKIKALEAFDFWRKSKGEVIIICNALKVLDPKG